jgi:hypothetical protein
MDIKSILTSKPHNHHYLNRYIKFIQSCKGDFEYTEKHHICPKSKNLFPEYSSFKDHPWNMIRLSARQHFLAHWMLWKTYGGDQVYAFDAMVNGQSKDNRINSRTYERLKSAARDLRSISKKGKAVYRDANDDMVYCATNDPRVLAGELTSLSAGRRLKKRSQESKERMRALMKEQRKNPNKKAVLYLKEQRIEVLFHSDEYRDLIAQGWSTKQTPEHKSLVSITANRTRKLLPKSQRTPKENPPRVWPSCWCILCRTEVSLHSLQRHFDGKNCRDAQKKLKF